MTNQNERHSVYTIESLEDIQRTGLPEGTVVLVSEDDFTKAKKRRHEMNAQHAREAEEDYASWDAHVQRLRSQMRCSRARAEEAAGQAPSHSDYYLPTEFEIAADFAIARGSTK